MNGRRGIYFLERRPDGDVVLWLRHRPPGEASKRKFGRSLGPLFKERGWPMSKISDARIMELLPTIRAEIDARAGGPPESAAPGAAHAGAELLALAETYAEDMLARGCNARYASEALRRIRACLGRYGSVNRARRTPPLPWARPANIDRRQFEDYMLARRRGEGGGVGSVSPDECNQDLRAWSAFATWLEDRGEIAANPLRRARKIRVPEAPPRSLAPDHVAALFRASREAGRAGWLYPAMHLWAYTGMRPCEIKAAAWEQVDLERRVLIVRRKRGAHWPIPICDELASFLGRTMSRDRVGPIVPGFPYGPRSPSYLRPFKRAAAAAGLGPDVTPYSLRHTVATELLRRGAPLAQVQAIMGHRVIQTTLRYARLVADDLHVDINRLSWSGRDDAPDQNGKNSHRRKHPPRSEAV